MLHDNSAPPVGIVEYRARPMIVPFPTLCFVGAFLTDIIYWRSAGVIWETFSIWLLTIGLVLAAVAIFFGMIGFVVSRAVRTALPGWNRILGDAVAVGLSVVNAFVHSRDGYTAVVPQGLLLSGLVVLILLVTRLTGRTPASRPVAVVG